jgi:hypothetical protein
MKTKKKKKKQTMKKTKKKKKFQGYLPQMPEGLQESARLSWIENYI